MQQPQSTELQICEQMANFKLQNYKFEFLTPQTYTMSQIKKTHCYRERERTNCKNMKERCQWWLTAKTFH